MRENQINKEFESIMNFSIFAGQLGKKAEGTPYMVDSVISDDELTDFMLERTELSETISRIIDEDEPRSGIVEAVEEELGFRPIFNTYPKYLDNYIPSVFEELIKRCGDESIKPLYEKLTIDPMCNVQSASYWLLYKKKMYFDKIGFLNALIYIYYRFRVDGYIDDKDADEISFEIFSRFLLLFNIHIITVNSFTKDWDLVDNPELVIGKEDE